MLGHIELDYTQLEGQFEKQAAKALEANRQTTLRLVAEWQSLRTLVAVSVLFMLLCMLFLLMSRPLS
ncbi:MAG: hypothetical protein CVU79_01155 [Elusimicrobia bacterium HGW-Elusimicrobia-3]|nr:MAG: hypothetical protein CVU79_01155 [Elusimicrobia bacterium HGW-Elusimicrobia-3]